MPHRPRSVMIVSEHDAFTQAVTELLPLEASDTLTSQNESFRMMNGHAAELAFKHDVVIFEADPSDEGEMNAIREMLSKSTGDTVFLAMTRNDVSISQAREMRDIGVDDVLPISITGEGLKAAVDEKLGGRTVVEQATPDGYSALGQVIAVTQARGGIGATTVAVNLACSLVNESRGFRKSEKRRVALLDLDLQFGNANVFMDLEDNGGFLQMLEARDEPDARFLGAALQKHMSGVDVLCAPVPIAPLQSMRSDVIAKVLEILTTKYDYVVVDLPRALVDWVEPVLKQASSLLMVTDTAVPSIRQAHRLMEFYREDNVGLPIDIIINREKKPMFKSEQVREAEKVLQTKLVHWLPDNPAVAREAVDLGQPIVTKRPRSDLGKALRKTAAALAADTHTLTRKNI